MNRTAYLENAHVAAFVMWFSQKIADATLVHTYLDRRSGCRLTFNGLPDAWAKYCWNKKNYCGNSRDLGLIRSALKEAFDVLDAAHRDCRVREASLTVFKWGHVTNGNSIWVSMYTTGLAERLNTVCAILRRDVDDESCFPADLRFNAGMTKVYSLLVPGSVIYDSRVAAALGWFVIQWLRENPVRELPEQLAFGWLPSKESPNARNPKNRNPSQQSYTFNMINSSANHLHWNIRASWVLRATLEKSQNLFWRERKDALRALEAALFMWGYDLG
jgi:hypothetical protein